MPFNAEFPFQCWRATRWGYHGLSTASERGAEGGCARHDHIRRLVTRPAFNTRCFFAKWQQEPRYHAVLSALLAFGMTNRFCKVEILFVVPPTRSPSSQERTASAVRLYPEILHAGSFQHATALQTSVCSFKVHYIGIGNLEEEYNVAICLLPGVPSGRAGTHSSRYPTEGRGPLHPATIIGAYSSP